MFAMPFQISATTVVVFSHPNHEIAIFGLLQTLKPHLVYLTDGGAQARVDQTRQGLESIGLLDRALFLKYTEKSFYEALLACDLEFYKEVAGQLRAFFQAIGPQQILCDAIEFYNPVHDMSLPIVRAALGESSTPVFEVPLIFQKPAMQETYELQRMCASRRNEQIQVTLSSDQHSAKAKAWNQIYTILTVQLGPLVSTVSHTDLAVEVIAPASSSLPQPGTGHALRYEHRAQTLLEQGSIDSKITHAQHYLPIANSLLDAGS